MSREYSIDSHDIFEYGSGWLEENVGLLFYEIFKRIPSVRKINYKVERGYIEEIKQRYQHEEAYDLFDMINYERKKDNEEDEEDDEENEKNARKSQNIEIYNCYVICKQHLIVSFFEDEVSIAYSDIAQEEIQSILQLGESYKAVKESLSYLFIVIYEHNYFYLKSSKVNQTNINIETHYNDDFLPIAQGIEEFLTANKSGLIILHGKQGTGKTTYIRHLINQGKKKMLYMGGDLVEKLSDPSFISFVRKQKDAIFIVEDCEELLASRNGSNRMNSGLINILNISDGLLSDELGIKFICTFNAPLKDIDAALLRKGRLAARYEFKDLAPDKVNNLIKEEKLNVPYQQHAMSLAELFNYENKDFSPEQTKIGF